MVYVPTAGKDDEEIGETEIQHREYYTIIMEDWKAKLDKGEVINGVLGPYGKWDRNERGERLIQFAQSNAFKIAGTLFKKREGERWTWESLNLEVKNDIDHMLTSDISIIKNINALARLAEIIEASEERGMKANMNKTKYMGNGKKKDNDEFKIKDTEIDEVKEYEYLGQIIVLQDRMEKGT